MLSRRWGYTKTQVVDLYTSFKALSTRNPNKHSSTAHTEGSISLQGPLPLTPLQGIPIPQASGDHPLNPLQLALAIRITRILIAVCLVILKRASIPRLPIEHISTAPMRQRITHNGAPFALRDRHRHSARDRARRGVLVADTCGEGKEVLDEGDVGRDAGGDAVGDHLAGLDGEGDGGFIGVRDCGHGDVPAKEGLRIERDYEVRGGAAFGGVVAVAVGGAGDEGWC